MRAPKRRLCKRAVASPPRALKIIRHTSGIQGGGIMLVLDFIGSASERARELHEGYENLWDVREQIPRKRSNPFFLAFVFDRLRQTFC